MKRVISWTITVIRNQNEHICCIFQSVYIGATHKFFLNDIFKIIPVCSIHPFPMSAYTRARKPMNAINESMFL
jgi:hypothetical protein